MLTYILNNGMLASGDIEDTLFYAGRFYETSCNMDSEYYITEESGDNLIVVGMIEEIEGQTLAFYAANESEYDTIKEHISVNWDDHWNYKKYVVINGRVFFSWGWETEELSHYDDYGETRSFIDKQEAQEFADTFYPQS